MSFIIVCAMCGHDPMMNLPRLTHTIAHRVGRYLERQGLLMRDTDQSYLTADAVDADNETPMNHLLGSSITYRIAVGPQQGRKVFTLQTLPNCSEDPLALRVGNVAGFSLHAGVVTRANERVKLERLCTSSKDRFGRQQSAARLK